MKRREFLKTSAVAAPLALSTNEAKAQKNELGAKLAQAMNAPVLKTELFKEPVKIAAIDLLKNGKN